MYGQPTPLGYVICANENCRTKAAPEDWQCEHCQGYDFLVPEPLDEQEKEEEEQHKVIQGLLDLPPFL